MGLLIALALSWADFGSGNKRDDRSPFFPVDPTWADDQKPDHHHAGDCGHHTDHGSYHGDAGDSGGHGGGDFGSSDSGHSSH
jgi:hypothetical protein